MPKQSEIFTVEAEAYIKDHWEEFADKDLSRFLKLRLGINATPDQVKGLRFRRGWAAGSHRGKSKVLGRGEILFPEEVKDLIAWLAPLMLDREIAELINIKCGLDRTEQQVYAWRKHYHIKNGRNFMFKPGHPPSSGAIKKGEHRGSSTQFKKGHRPKNSMKIGDEVLICGYWKRKVAEPNVWKLRSRWVWERAHGPLKPGDVLVHIDGNSENDSLENLRLVNRAVMGRINTQARWSGRELTEDQPEWNNAVISIAELETKIAEASK